MMIKFNVTYRHPIVTKSPAADALLLRAEVLLPRTKAKQPQNDEKIHKLSTK